MLRLGWSAVINLQKDKMFFYVLDNQMEYFHFLILTLWKAFIAFKFKNLKLILFLLIHLENGLLLHQKWKANYLFGNGNQKLM
jgi:hypothetical protein